MKIYSSTVKFYAKNFMAFFLVMSGCKSVNYIQTDVDKPLKVFPETNKSGFKTYVLDENDYPNYTEGPAVLFWETGIIREFGQLRSVKVPKDIASSNSEEGLMLSSVKYGKWFFYDQEGAVDSILDFKTVQGFKWDIDTVYNGNRPYAVDSILHVEYEIESVYRKK